MKLKHQENAENPVKDIFLAAGGHDNIIRVFRIGETLNTSEMVYEITDAHSDMVRDLKFSPNVLDDFYTLASCSEDGLLVLMTLPVEMTGHSIIKVVCSGDNNRDPIWRLCWTMSGRVVSGVSLGDDKRASVVSICKKAENEWYNL